MIKGMWGRHQEGSWTGLQIRGHGFDSRRLHTISGAAADNGSIGNPATQSRVSRATERRCAMWQIARLA
jgi:hypothetical protein